VKALIGVDSLGQCSSALELVRRLDFAAEKVILLHSVESVMPDGSFPGLAGGGTYTDMLTEFEHAGHIALDEAAAACGAGANIEKKQMPGDPLRNLLDMADDQEIDLIAVGTQKKSSLQAMLMGSVTRGLLTASTHSFLAAKDIASKEGPLTAVVATDHSDYADQVIDLLVQFAPKGIGRIVVLAVIDPKAQRAVHQFKDDPELSSNVDLWAEDRLHHENMAVCRKLAAIAPVCEERVEHGEVNDVIRTTMADVGGDLLILGAQGHGVIERLRSGSVSFHQVVAENYPVLVLRTPA
jgi:nucleotide-binding universal stress UspA family protein